MESSIGVSDVVAAIHRPARCERCTAWAAARWDVGGAFSNNVPSLRALASPWYVETLQRLDNAVSIDAAMLVADFAGIHLRF
ncbi:hypothetical protein C41B8_12795 [Salinisphaera hydrothermalis C41B8]|uniref:Uncharacterized protein n=1 Tax=Salinisphaera hydrothermalis (strain C41B8) TaxID=1304275 RepID=A0A084IJF1_SALHC|nr:hypothetical protein C41B8_12795 [Salinisphaera hydrothermalis C41B8]